MTTLGSTSFGQANEFLSIVYRQFVRTNLNYASTAWYPTISNTNRLKLERVQNRALRIITGCVKTTPVHHLQSEAKVLPIEAHLDMIGSQFFSKASTPDHPCHHTVQAPTPPRNKKVTPSQYYTEQLRRIPPTSEGISRRKHLHTAFTQRSLNQQPPNTLRNARPPDID